MLSHSSSCHPRSRSPRSMYNHHDIPAATQPTPSRKPRPRSPPMMFGVYEISTPKPPKPLLKLDKKLKSKAPLAYPTPPNSPCIPASNHRCSTVALFRGIRRRATSILSPTIPSSPTSVPRHNDLVGESCSEKVNQAPAESAEQCALPEQSEEASWRNIHAATPTGTFSTGEGSFSLGGESRDDECFADDLYCDGESPTPSPMYFATRPPSFMPQGESHDVGSRPNTASMDTSVALHSQMVGGYGRQGAMLKRSWVGEWNEEDIQEVITKLRFLK